MRNLTLDPAPRIKAIDVLNRMDGLYVQKVNVIHRTPLDLSRLTVEELALLERLVRKAQPAPGVHSLEAARSQGTPVKSVVNFVAGLTSGGFTLEGLFNKRGRFFER